MRFIGCKTLLLENIKNVIDKHVNNAHSICDIFSGTASVARYFKQWYEVYSNDLLFFSYCLQKGTIENDCVPSFTKLCCSMGIKSPIDYFNSMDSSEMGEKLPESKRFFQNNYSPNGGRMYLTDVNALRIDFARNKINEWKECGLISEMEFFYLIACIIEGIPFVSNIKGTYGAFSKTWDIRTAKTFSLIELPVFSNGKRNRSFNEDGAALLKSLEGDILYIDPPYNERQYLPNYHLLETAAKYDNPKLHGLTGQRPYEGQKSSFCSKKTAIPALHELISNAHFKHIILSYNTDGIMSLPEIESTMKAIGKPETFEVNFIPFRRFKSRSEIVQVNELKEMLIYIEKEVSN